MNKVKKNLIFIIIMILIVCLGGLLVVKLTDDNGTQDKISEKENVKKETKAKKVVFEPLVPETSKNVKNSYFDDAVFIGDSRSEGLKVYGDLTNATFFTEVGMNVDKALSEPCIFYNGSSMTLENALDVSQFKKVYIMLGINEVNWPYPEVFIDKYSELLKMIQKKQPDAIIYVESMMPTGIGNSSGISNEKIISNNSLIYEMCRANKWYYIDMYNTLVGSDGYLSGEYSSDGIHMNTQGCQVWVDILKKHTIKR